ncbi:MAG: T9SS type A sorting domain-containing protein, partial [Ignavibacteriaceae bacterium]
AGFYSSADSSVQNVWLDGSGHMICAFYFAGYADTAEYYSNQLDLFLINRNIDGTASLSLPYTANKTGGYDWVDINKGFSSSCAWYIFAKEKFNPFTLETYKVTGINKNETGEINYRFKQNYPNPFNLTTRIVYTVPSPQHVEITVYDVLGNSVRTLFNGVSQSGKNKIDWNGKDNNGNVVGSGIYFYKIKMRDISFSGKMILEK